MQQLPQPPSHVHRRPSSSGRPGCRHGSQPRVPQRGHRRHWPAPPAHHHDATPPPTRPPRHPTVPPPTSSTHHSASAVLARHVHRAYRRGCHGRGHGRDHGRPPSQGLCPFPARCCPKRWAAAPPPQGAVRPSLPRHRWPQHRPHPLPRSAQAGAAPSALAWDEVQLSCPRSAQPASRGKRWAALRALRCGAWQREPPLAPPGGWAPPPRRWARGTWETRGWPDVRDTIRGGRRGSRTRGVRGCKEMKKEAQQCSRW